MHWRWRLFGLLVSVLAAVPLVGLADDSATDVAGNWRLLRRWKEDPEHYARLQREWKAFHALPPERQERMRQLDRDLYAADAVTQQRLWGVLERYSTWLDQLPATDRGRIEAAGNPEQRLRLIQELRDKQWLAYLPAETRKALDTELQRQFGAAAFRDHAEIQEPGKAAAASSWPRAGPP